MPDAQREAASRNVTDLRRSRQHARAVISEVQDDIEDFLEGRDISRVGRSERDRQRMNEAITRLAQAKLASDLVQWLTRRRGVTMGRAVRAALDQMQQTLRGATTQPISLSDLRGQRDTDAQTRHLNRAISQIDAGLLYQDDDSLADEVGDRVTRQLRLGHARNEPLRTSDPDELSLTKRVAMVLREGDASLREKAGVTGQTVQTKAEMIAHDSVQQGYTSAATQRYLQNGFQYVEYDAVCDFRTSNLCERLGECHGDAVIIDLRKTPWLVPPNHIWCRSDTRPHLYQGDRTPITEENISDRHLQKIMDTEQYRPTVLDVEGTLNRSPLQRGMDNGGVGA